MKILYGVCGEGFGHSSRAKKLIPFLQDKGHEVLVVTYGQAVRILKDFKKIKVEGIKLFFVDGKMSLRKTFVGNFNGISKNIKNWDKIWSAAKKFSPDVCISDMDLLVPIISYYLKTPLISFDNQHRLTNQELNVPAKYYKDYFIAKSAVNLVVSRAEAFIVLSFVKTKSKNNTFVVDPILRDEIIKIKPSKKNFILVYMTKPDKKILATLKKVNAKFIVYGYNKIKKESNLQFKKIGNEFLKDLKNCKAIIASSGFTLMSEAIYLKKPYFAVPLIGQFEQTLNSLFLRQAKFGEFSESPTEKEIKNFLNSLNFYEKNLKNHKTDPEESLKVLKKVLETIK